MKKKEIYEGVVEKIEFPNKGIVMVEGQEQPVIVKNTIPGQQVRFQINKLKKGKAEGRLLEVVKKSPMEIASPCPHFYICGGCNYQSLPIVEENKLKEAQVRELLEKYFTEETQVEPILNSPVSKAYRNKMEFSFGDEIKDGPLALGMHKRWSHYDIVNVEQCQIVDEDFRMILKATKQYFEKENLPFYHKMRHTGYLRHLLVRKGMMTGEILVDLITTNEYNREEKVWSMLLKKLPLNGNIVGILHTHNDSVADVVKDEGTTILYGQDYFYEKLLQLQFRISPFSFFQTNSKGAEVLYEKVREYVGSTKDKVVFDLYSGTGTIAQIIAPVAKKVVGVEIVPEAVEAAKQNALFNHLPNCSFIPGDVLKVIDEIEEKPDIIILDPPRDGIHPKALEKIINYGVSHMVYISCKPTSLERDLAVLTKAGYEMIKICPVNQFPGTVHVETVVLLSYKKIEEHVKLSYEPEQKPSTHFRDATYEEIKSWVLEHYEFKVSSLYIAQVKDECGLGKRENYNKSKKKDAKVPLCPENKKEAIKAALEYFEMISDWKKMPE